MTQDRDEEFRSPDQIGEDVWRAIEAVGGHVPGDRVKPMEEAPPWVKAEADRLRQQREGDRLRRQREAPPTKPSGEPDWEEIERKIVALDDNGLREFYAGQLSYRRQCLNTRAIVRARIAAHGMGLAWREMQRRGFTEAELERWVEDSTIETVDSKRLVAPWVSAPIETQTTYRVYAWDRAMEFSVFTGTAMGGGGDRAQVGTVEGNLFGPQFPDQAAAKRWALQHFWLSMQWEYLGGKSISAPLPSLRIGGAQ